MRNNKNHYSKIISEFPEFYKNLDWGFECEEGWFSLLYDLSNELNQAAFNGRVVQVKEKFGGLRFYWNETVETVDEKYKEWTEIINKAEEDSYTICEVCGEEGKLRKGSWLKTLCEKHHKEREVQHGK